MLFDWTTTKEELGTIRRIVDRADALFEKYGMEKLDRMELLMDIEATHKNGCPLRLDDLLAADESNFSHDIGGIRRHMDRATGKLTGCFLPRFAAPRQAVAS